MKVSIFGILCLLMMVLYSHSFPQMSEECSHCGAGHEACWEICLSSYSQDDEYYNEYDDPTFSTNNNMPCGKIRTCLKPIFSNKPMCKTAPKELPVRCDKPDEPTGGKGMSCGLIRMSFFMKHGYIYDFERKFEFFFGDFAQIRCTPHCSKFYKNNYLFSLCSPRLILTRSPQISGQNKSEAREPEGLVKITYGIVASSLFKRAGNSN